MPAWVVAGLLGGAAASITSTVAQLLLWALLDHRGVLELLWRDMRLAAAILLGTEVLPPSRSSAAAAVVAASVVHVLLSLAYGAAIAWLQARLRAPGWLVGAAAGLLIYAIALHGATLVFPWFEQSRGWITLLAHLVFGLTVALVASAWLRRAGAQEFHVHSAASRP